MSVMIILKPNWAVGSYTPVAGNYGPISTGNLFLSDNNFFIGDVLKIKKSGVGIYKYGEIFIRVISSSVDPISSLYQIGFIILSGKINVYPTFISSIEIFQSEKSYYLDGALDLNLNMRIYDIEAGVRSSTYTKTIEIPFTKNNNKIFTQLFNINTTEGYNPKLKSECQILEGGVLITSGYLQIIDVDISEKVYRCVYYGENKNLFDDLGDKLITGNTDLDDDIDFSDWIHNKWSDTILDSWEGNRPYIYGLIYDNSSALTINLLNSPLAGIENYRLKPFIRAKGVLDKIFWKWGWTYDSNFLNSDLFSELVCLPTTSQSGWGESQIEYSLNTSTNITSNVPNAVPLNTQVIDIFGSKYNTTDNYFIAPYTGYFGFKAELILGWTPASFASPTAFYSANYRDIGEIHLQIVRNGYSIYDNKLWTETGAFGSFFISPVTKIPGSNSTNGLINIELDIPIKLMAGDRIYFWTLFKNMTGATTTYQYLFLSGSKINIFGDKEMVDLGYTFQGIKQTDFVSDLFKMFNLQMMPDKSNPRRFIIEPRDDFYKRGSIIDDINYDVDDVQFGYELNNSAKRWIFTYGKGDDTPNKTFMDENPDRVYGDAIVEIKDDFLTDEKKIELNAVPTLFRRITDDVWVPSLEGASISSKLRWMFYNGKKTISTPPVILYNLFDDETTTQVYPLAYYPSFSNWSEWFNSKSQSVLFANILGDNEKEKSLYYTYYENELETYNEPTAHILELKCYINTNILSRINFNDIYYFEIEGNAQYYTLLEINNYNPSGGLCDCKFMVYYDFQASKPKRTRYVTPKVNGNRIGILESLLGYDKDIMMTPGGDGNIINGASGALIVGKDIVLSGDNKDVLATGDDILVGPTVSRVTILGGKNLKVSGDNIISLGGDTKDLVEPNAVYINDHFQQWDEFDTDTIITATQGQLVMNDNDLRYYDNGIWKAVNSDYTIGILSDDLLISTVSWINMFDYTLIKPGAWDISITIGVGDVDLYGVNTIGLTGSQNNQNKEFTIVNNYELLNVTNVNFKVNGLQMYTGDFSISGVTLSMVELTPDPTDILELRVNDWGFSYQVRIVEVGVGVVAKGRIYASGGFNTSTIRGIVQCLTTPSRIQIDIYSESIGTYVYKDWTGVHNIRIY